MYFYNKTSNEKFKQLREDYKTFTFEAFHTSYDELGLNIIFDFNIDHKIYFNPKISIPFNFSFNRFNKHSLDELDSIVFNMGMVELISYWKCICPKKLIIAPYSLTNEQESFWRKIYFNGLGEFFYTNKIETNIHDFIQFEYPNKELFEKVDIPKTDNEIIPIGGGKDSVVTLELLNLLKIKAVPFIINPRGASQKSAIAAGFIDDDIIKVIRSIDLTLLDLNSKGYLNGHTPFSAMLGFTGILAGKCCYISNIALSNEASANEATVIGTDINHQYSKSFEFETDFRNYVHKFLSPNFNYYSLLRPLSELQIAALFAQETKYNTIFKSCNVGSKTDSWCCKCSKCLFTFILLSPFISNEDLIFIYGEDLLEKESLLPILLELCGLTDEKPFECVGTIEEVNVALCQIIKKHDFKSLPFLLKKYSELPIYQTYKNSDISKYLKCFNHEHNLDKHTFNIISKRLEWISSKI